MKSEGIEPASKKPNAKCSHFDILDDSMTKNCSNVNHSQKVSGDNVWCE